jgi:hypothetical protein
MSGESIGEGPMVCGVFLAKYKMCKESREIPDRLLTTIMAWSNARTCPQCLYGPYIIVIVLGAWIPVRIQGLKNVLSLSPSHGLRVSETDFLTMVFASEMFSRFHCCFGQDVRPNIRWVKARGQVSPWHPDRSAPEIAPASDARFLIQTTRVSASGSENDSECKNLGEYDASCCAASTGRFSWADSRSNTIAKSISMEKSDFFNLISGFVLFLYCGWNCKKPGFVFDKRWLGIQWFV